MQGVAYIEDVGKIHPGPLLGDRSRLRQVIANAISNAAKFTEKGSVTFRVRQICDTSTAVRLQFTVLDTGCGISAAVLPTLFQPFRQADSSTARRYGGTGLGLTISRELITLMGGTVELNSEEGKGTAMVITVFLHKNLQSDSEPNSYLPSDAHSDSASDPGLQIVVNQGLDPSASCGQAGTNRDDLVLAEVQQAGRQAQSQSNEWIKRKPEDVTILVAEDNELLRSLLVKMLARLKFTVVAVEDGAFAVRAVHEGHVDLILMDGQMPNKDGYQATREIRSDPDPIVAALPIIALTASAFKGDRERCLEAGMSHYLSKPVRSQELEQAIWDQLDKQGDAATLSHKPL